MYFFISCSNLDAMAVHCLFIFLFSLHFHGYSWVHCLFPTVHIMQVRRNGRMKIGLLPCGLQQKVWQTLVTIRFTDSVCAAGFLGSHDSMSYDLDVNSSIIEPDNLKKFSWICCVRKIMHRWATTQVSFALKLVHVKFPLTFFVEGIYVRC